MFTVDVKQQNNNNNINIFHYFSEKIRLDVSSESSARQRIHMQNQALFSSKDKSIKFKCRPLQFLFGALIVNFISHRKRKLYSIILLASYLRRIMYEMQITISF